VASQRIKPDWFRVPAETVFPTDLSTGILSPVSVDSSTALSPSKITPSTGIFSPGRTTKISPIATCSTGTTISLLSRISVAVFGANCISPFRALVVLPLERASSIFPTVIRARIIAADSK